MAQRWWGAACAAIYACLAAQVAQADDHTPSFPVRLVSSEPASGASIFGHPTSVTLEFSRRLDGPNGFWDAQVYYDGLGSRRVALPASVRAFGSIMTVTLRQAAKPGKYTVSWQAKAADATARGSLVFTVR